MKNPLKDYWYHWYPSRYSRKTTHLCPYQDGLYRRLIDHYMLTKEALPDNDCSLARITGVSLSDFLPHSKIIREFFRAKKGLLFNYACEEVLARQIGNLQIRKNSASKASKTRWKKEKENQSVKCVTHSNRNAEPMRPDAREDKEKIREEDKAYALSPPIPPKGELDFSHDQTFEDFWTVFPDGRPKGSKGAAKEKFKKIMRSGVPITEIAEGVSRYRRFCDDGNFNQHALTWLNQKGWVEEWKLGKGVKNAESNSKSNKLALGDALFAGFAIAPVEE